VDFYLIDGQPMFSELTHYTGGGSVSFGSREQDRIMGDMWDEALRCPHPSAPHPWTGAPPPAALAHHNQDEGEGAGPWQSSDARQFESKTLRVGEDPS
jgi:hypothetical protein